MTTANDQTAGNLFDGGRGGTVSPVNDDGTPFYVHWDGGYEARWTTCLIAYSIFDKSNNRIGRSHARPY